MQPIADWLKKLGMSEYAERFANNGINVAALRSTRIYCAGWRSSGGHGITISMDGKGAWRDNVFVERLWRSVKYEEVYLRAYESVSEARASIGRYFEFYNQRRPHASLDGSTPDQAYFTPLPLRTAA
jgi:transposase InsO family protein